MIKKKDKSKDESHPKKGKESISDPELQTLVGIEVDGTEVHVAYVEGNGTVHVEHFRELSSVKALDAALNSIPPRAEIVRVAFTGGRQYVRRVEVPVVPERAMRAAMMAIAEENLPIVPGAASVAGLIIGNPDTGRDIDDPRGASKAINMVIAAVESDDLDPVWHRLGGRRAPITSASFLLPADGLYLRVARATSEMIILRGGVPLLARSLRVGGLDELERRIRAGEQSSVAPSFDSAVENSDDGKSAAEITDSYLDELVTEFRKTLVFWKREGTEVPSDIIVLGVGATIPTLLTRVRDAGFNISPIPEPRDVHLAMADHEKPVAFQALAAAYSDFSQQPYAILPNPVYDAQKLAAKAKAKQRTVMTMSAGVIAVILALASIPLGYAKTREALATSSKNEAEKNIIKFRPLIFANDQLAAGESAVEALETSVPAYTKVICSVLSSAPAQYPTDFKNLAIATTETGTSVDTSVSVQDGTPGFEVIGDWETRLQKTISSQEITVGSFRFNSDLQTKDASFRWVDPIALEAFKVPNVQSCEGYKDGLSERQLKRIEMGYDSNDETVTFNDQGKLVFAKNGKIAPDLTATSTTTTTSTTKPKATTTTAVPVTTTGGVVQ